MPFPTQVREYVTAFSELLRKKRKMNENNENKYSPEQEDLIKVINTGSKSRVASKRKKYSVVILSVFIGLCFFLTVMLVAVNTVFRITSIELLGCEYYSQDQILEAIELDVGDNIFLVNEKKYASKLSTGFPMVYSLKVEKEYPSTVRITITEEIPSYSFEYAGEYAVVSKMGKVIFLGKSIPEKFSHVMKMKVPEVASAVEGFVIEYRDSYDREAVEEVLTKLRECSFSQRIVFVEMSSRFNIKVSYGDRFTILLGDRSDFDVKLKFVDGIIETLKKDEKGTINVKNPKKGYFILE